MTRMSAGDVLGQGDFVLRLVERVPEVEIEVRDHLECYDELLLHLLMPDLLEAAVRFFHEGELDVEQRLLRFIDLALRQGDAAVRNAVQASFVENVAPSLERPPNSSARGQRG